MRVLNIEISDKALASNELSKSARELKIPHIRGVFMRDTLPRRSSSTECGIVKLNTSNQPDIQWVCYYRNKNGRIYFDLYGQVTPLEIQRYLKTSREFDSSKEVIQRNTDIVKAANTPVCDHLCLFVLKSQANGEQFQTILNHKQHYGGYT